MPYKTNSDLPANVRAHLPEKAQTIYRKAFSAAYHEYANEAKRQDPHASLDSVAARVAWAAVKKAFEKDASGKWVEKASHS